MQRSQIFVQNRVFLPTPPAFDAPVSGISVGISPSRLAWKTRMAWLRDGEKISKIPLGPIRFHATHERDRQTDRRTPHDDIGRAYASHRAAKTTCLRQY